MTQPHDSESTRPAASQRRLKGWVIVLLCLIISGAFAFSAETWIGLAESTGFRTAAELGRVTLRLAWMLPIALDGYLCLTTWLYLTSRPGSALRRWAAGSLLIVVTLSVAAQGLYHALVAQGADVNQVTVLVVTIGGLPPLLLASSVHLLSVYLHHRGDSVDAVRPARPRPRRAPEPRPASSRPTVEPTPETGPESHPVKQQHLSLVSPRRASTADSTGRAGTDDAALADAIRDHVLTQRRAGAPPVQREMQRLVLEATGARVGQKRCVRIAKAITEEDGGGRADDDKEGEAA